MALVGWRGTAAVSLKGPFSLVHHTPHHPLRSHMQSFSHISSTFLASIGLWVYNLSLRCPVIALLTQRTSAGGHALVKLICFSNRTRAI